MSAKTFAYATGCRVVGIESFAAIARQSPSDITVLDVIADAQQDKVYVQRFERDHDSGYLVASSTLEIVPLAAWMSKRGKDVWAAGPGLRLCQARLGEKCLCVPADLWDPRPETLLQMGLECYRAGDFDNFWSLEPIYLRPSSAEEKWRDKQASNSGNGMMNGLGAAE